MTSHVPFQNRFIHIKGECVHLDGTRHKIQRKQMKCSKKGCSKSADESIGHYSEGTFLYFCEEHNPI